MALLTTLTSANEVLLDSVRRAPEYATIDGQRRKRFRTTRTIEYRGLTQATAESYANDPASDLAGTILSDGAASGTTLHVDGFTEATGTVWAGTAVEVDGDDHIYHTDADATISGNECDLTLDENIIEPGTILVDGGSQTGSSLHIDGFSNPSGYVRKGTLLEISGDATDYTVTSEATIAGNETSVSISPALSGSPADNAGVTLTHPVDNTGITLTQSGASVQAVRAGENGSYTLRIIVDYTTAWEDD